MQEAESKFKPRPQSYVRAPTLNFCCCQKQRFMLKKHSQRSPGWLALSTNGKKEVGGGVVESFSDVQINHEFLFESFPILYVLCKHVHYNELCKKRGGAQRKGNLSLLQSPERLLGSIHLLLAGRLCRHGRMSHPGS